MKAKRTPVHLKGKSYPGQFPNNPTKPKKPSGFRKKP